MMALLITTCLLSDPTACRVHTVPIYEPMSSFQCMMQAPASLAAWHQTHPDRRITRWRCHRPEERKAQR